MRKQIWQTLVPGLLVGILSQAVAAVLKFLVDALEVKLGPIQFLETFKIISWIFLPLMIILFVGLIIIALFLGSRPFPIQNVNEPVGHRFNRWQRIIGLPSFWSQFRLTIASGLVVISILLYHSIRTSFGIEHLVLISIVATDIFLQFYVATGDIRNSLNRSISQLVMTLGQQIELVLQETYGQTHFRLRIRVLILDNDDQKFSSLYEYKMDGEPDINLRIGIAQGVAGRVFADKKPWMQKPYKPEELGFSEEQLSLIPRNIKWKMVFPLLSDHTSFGVLAIDCDKDLNRTKLGKILDYTLGITNGLSVLLSQFPSREIQMAIPN